MEIVEQFQRLGVSQDATSIDVEERSARLQRTRQEWFKDATCFARGTQQVQTIDGEDRQAASRDVANLAVLAKQCNKLCATIQEAKDALHDEILIYIISLGGENETVCRLLKYFEAGIKTIIARALGTLTDSSSMLTRIIEECYNQAIDQSGELGCDGLAMEFLLPALDPPRNSFLVRLNLMRSEKVRGTMHRAWVQFWTSELEQLADGPTLFTQDINDTLNPSNPRYLFRAYDENTYGKNET